MKLIITARTKVGEGAILQAIEEDKRASIRDRIIANRTMRKEIVSENPLTLEIHIFDRGFNTLTSVAMGKAVASQEAVNQIERIMSENGAKPTDYEYEVL